MADRRRIGNATACHPPRTKSSNTSPIGWKHPRGFWSAVHRGCSGRQYFARRLWNRTGFIEVNGPRSVLLWRMSVDSDVHRRESKTKAGRSDLFAACFLLLGAYNCTYDSILDLWFQSRAPEHSISGIGFGMCLAGCDALWLSRAKTKSGPCHGEAPPCTRTAKATNFAPTCPPFLLVGLLLNAFWAGGGPIPLAALIMVPIIAKEGLDGGARPRRVRTVAR